MTKRLHNRPWKRLTDRGFNARVARAKARGEYTEPGTKPNATDPAKVERKHAARRAAA